MLQYNLIQINANMRSHLYMILTSYTLFLFTFSPAALMCFPPAAHIPVIDAALARPCPVCRASDASPAPAPLLHREGSNLVRGL